MRFWSKPATAPSSVPSPMLNPPLSLQPAATVSAQPPSMTEPMPPATPDSAPTRRPARTVQPKRTRKPAKKAPRKLYPVFDRRGVVVGTSTKPTAQETAETHASAFLEWLSDQDSWRGSTVLYQVLCGLYVDAYCPATGLKPFPWPKVAKALSELPGVRRGVLHVDRDDGRRRVKLQAYQLPEPDAAVVELDAVRKRA